MVGGIRRLDALMIGILTVIVGILFTIMTDAMIYEDIGTDYFDQILDARSVIATGENTTARPNLLFNRSLVLMQQTLNIEPMDGALIVSVLYYVLTALTVYALLRPAFGIPYTLWHGLANVGITLTLLVAMPFNLFSQREYDPMYIGYFAFSIYHNPTTVLAKFFALPQIWLTLWAFQPAARGRGGLWLALAVITAVSLMAKFSFTSVLFPALVLLVGWKAFRREPVDGVMVGISGAILLIGLGLQWQLAGVETGDTRIILAPFAYYEAANKLNAWLPLKWAASLLFPLLVTSLYWRRVWQDDGLRLAWLALAVGIAQAVLLAEESWRIAHGNLVWGAMYANFVLFVLATRFIIIQFPASPRRALVALAGLAVHLVTGVYWYGFTLAVTP